MDDVFFLAEFLNRNLFFTNILYVHDHVDILV